jgi:gluconate 2-dehydrogenase gamma chain
MERTLTRRDLFKIAGAAGALTIIPAAGEAPAALFDTGVEAAAGAAQAVTSAAREPLQALTAAEADILDAVVARLIPTDAAGPGAREAMAARYIDRALAGALAGSREAYRVGLAAFDRLAQSSHGASFTALAPADQDAVLTEVETGTPEFFSLVRGHTLQGTFGDPYYGGNANFVGWDLIGYPGVRTFVAPADQRIGITVAPNHRSAYDGNQFNKAQASAPHDQGGAHGD